MMTMVGDAPVATALRLTSTVPEPRLDRRTRLLSRVTIATKEISLSLQTATEDDEVLNDRFKLQKQSVTRETMVFSI
jgi:hypothetical protein